MFMSKKERLITLLGHNSLSAQQVSAQQVSESPLSHSPVPKVDMSRPFADVVAESSKKPQKPYITMDELEEELKHLKEAKTTGPEENEEDYDEEDTVYDDDFIEIGEENDGCEVGDCVDRACNNPQRDFNIPDSFGKPLFPLNENEIQKYMTVEFEVKDEFKPVFKTILSMVGIFRNKYITCDEMVLILNGLVKNINLESKKLNWIGWRETVASYTIMGHKEDIFKYSIDDFKKAGISVEYIEKSCTVSSYLERERRSREFLDCYQRDKCSNYMDIEIPTWKRMAEDIFADTLSVFNIRKDPKSPFSESEGKVYCTVRFPLSHSVVPVHKVIGQFIGTFAYANADELSVPNVKFLITDGCVDETVEMFALGNCDSLSIRGFEDIEINLDYFKEDLGEIPSEIDIQLQDINTSCEIDIELELNPVLNESMQILQEYICFCKKHKYVSSREMLEEILDLLSIETDLTRSYASCDLGLNMSLNYYHMCDDEIDMRDFALTLPMHLREKVLEVYTENYNLKADEDKGFHLYDGFREMLGYIKDIEKFNIRFVHAPFKTDDPHEPEIVEKVFIEFKATIMGTNMDDLRYHYKNISKNIKNKKCNIKILNQ